MRSISIPLSITLLGAGGMLICAGMGTQIVVGTAPALQGSALALPGWIFASVAGCGGLLVVVGIAGLAGTLAWRWRVVSPVRTVRTVLETEYALLLRTGTLVEVPAVVPEHASLQGRVAGQPVLVRLLREHHRLLVAIESTYLHTPLPAGARAAQDQGVFDQGLELTVERGPGSSRP